jgi:hypothetical protein
MPYRATNLKYVSESIPGYLERQVIFLLFLLFLINLSQMKGKASKIVK